MKDLSMSSWTYSKVGVKIFRFLTLVMLLACLTGCENPESYNKPEIKPYAMGPNQLPNNEIPAIKVPVNVTFN